jgi:hypothetical protein
VIVIGAGVAGTAAAFRAVQLGQKVVWLTAGIGASCATSGALDWGLCDSGEQLAGPGHALGEFATLIGWNLPRENARVVTETGVTREARGADAAILDLAGLANGTLAVLDVGRPDWDASWVCRALNQDPWTRTRKLRFDPLRVDLLEPRLDPRLSPAEYARALAEQLPSLQAALAKALDTLPQRPMAALAGPWLCATLEVAKSFRSSKVPVGEALSPPYGLAGCRFEAARDAWAAQQPLLERCALRAERVTCQGGEVTVFAQGKRWTAPRCILALGSIAGGGLLLDAEQRVQLSLALTPAPVFQQGGRPWLPAASATGVDVQSLGVGQLLAIGLAKESVPGLTVVGDLLSDRPRTALRAAESGLGAFG